MQHNIKKLVASKHRKTFYDWLTTRFVVSLRNEDNFALKRSFTLNYAQILVFLLLSFILFSVFYFYIFKNLYDYYNNDYENERRLKLKYMKMSLKVDSLQKEVAMRDTFIQHFKTVIKTGKNVSALKQYSPSQPLNNDTTITKH
ncbi:MAG: hypothetical protein NW207_05270 [Cytophagales bacterium]|nr:hypothetical protein [Cytophagales bacterium]